MILAMILAIVTIVLAIIFWLFNPRQAKEYIKSIFRQKIKIDSIIELEKHGFKIENKELLHDKKLRYRNRWIFWPVVPTDSPNIIHLTFIRFLKDLSCAGLLTVVFVFDNYYGLIKNKSPSTRDLEVNQFINSLNQMGLKHCKCKIIYESRFLSTYRLSHFILSEFLNYLNNIDIRGLEILGNKKGYLTSEAKALRYVKPCLNMLYLGAIDKPCGFTLSGYDEQPQWEMFKNDMPKGKDIRLTNLYIPCMRSLTGDSTDVLDKDGNITHSDSITDVRRKLSNSDYLSSQDNVVCYFLQIHIFLVNETIRVPLKKPDALKEFKTLNELMSDFQAQEINKNLVDMSISTVIYELMHPPLDAHS